jgi:hypothetical protein
MRVIFFTLLTLLFFGCKLNSNNNFEGDEKQVIKILFNNIKSDELKNKNFMVIISNSHVYMNYRPTNLIVWFDYKCDDQDIILNYFSFPKPEKFVEQFYDIFGKPFYIFLEEIIHNKKIVNAESAKQLKIPLPVGLRNNVLINRAYYNKKWPDGYILREGGGGFCFGFKSDKIEMRHDNYAHYGELLEEVQDKIIDPIIYRIYYYETPEEWKKEYEKLNDDDSYFNDKLRELGIIQ